MEPEHRTPLSDRLCKVCTFFGRVQQKCQTNFSPSKNPSAYEGMISFRGRLSFRQYTPAKPTK